MIKALFGLGNPGAQYEYTPHNVGFAFLDTLCDCWSSCRGGVCGRVQEYGVSFFCVKPEMFMNNSGDCVGVFLQKNGIKPEEVIVVYDDADVPLGRVRFVFGGGARGHNGLRSIAARVGERFWRLGVGVGRGRGVDLGTFVLKRMPLPQWEDVLAVFDKIYEHRSLMFSLDEKSSQAFVGGINGS